MTGYHWNHGCTMLHGGKQEKKISGLRSQNKIQLVQFRSIKEKNAKKKKISFTISNTKRDPLVIEPIMSVRGTKRTQNPSGN